MSTRMTGKGSIVYYNSNSIVDNNNVSMLTKKSKLMFKDEINYHAAAHRAIKWSRFIQKLV